MNSIKICGLLGNIPKNEYSHNAAYAKIWSNILNVPCEFGSSTFDTDSVIIYMGINFTGGLNLFGGLNKTVYDKCLEFIEYSGNAYCLDYDLPDLGLAFKSRIGNSSTYELVNEEFCDRLSARCKQVKTITMNHFIKDSLVIGDSHSLSITPPKTPVIRCDGKTLHGALKDNYINDLIPDSVKNLTLMFGSIDIRHHIFRQVDSKDALQTLCLSYLNKINELQNYGIYVTVAMPVPVESEERKMSNTTKYKGEPFCGSRKQRLSYTLAFIKIMNLYSKSYNFDIIQYPDAWYSMDPKEFETNIMERPKSIHIGYPNYRINNFGVL